MQKCEWFGVVLTVIALPALAFLAVHHRGLRPFAVVLFLVLATWRVLHERPTSLGLRESPEDQPDDEE